MAAILDLCGVVGDAENGFDSVMVADAIRGYTGPLKVLINSTGGDAQEAITVHNLLASRRPEVEVIGIAGGAASIIAMAGETVHVCLGAMMTIEPARGVLAGAALAMAAQSKNLRAINDSFADIYATRSGKSIAEVHRLMEAETWLTGERAVATGFADSHGSSKPKFQVSRAALADLERKHGRNPRSARERETAFLSLRLKRMREAV